MEKKFNELFVIKVEQGNIYFKNIFAIFYMAALLLKMEPAHE